MVDNIRSQASRRLEPQRPEATTRSTAVAKPEHTKPEHATSTGQRAGSLMARATAAAAETPEVNRQRVDDIKMAISRGEFHLDAKAVAHAFVSMTLSATRE